MGKEADEGLRIENIPQKAYQEAVQKDRRFLTPNQIAQLQDRLQGLGIRIQQEEGS